MMPVAVRSLPAHLALAGLSGAVLAFTGCGSTAHRAASSSPSLSTRPGSGLSAGAKPIYPPASPLPAAVTVASADLPGYGRVLVDGTGRALYILSTQRYGPVTCTDASGCTRYWPPVELGSGVRSARAGTGIDPILLGTVDDGHGQLEVTYGGWPIYRYSGDRSPGQASGEGISSFGGSWYLLGVAGQPVTAKTGS